MHLSGFEAPPCDLSDASAKSRARHAESQRRHYRKSRRPGGEFYQKEHEQAILRALEDTIEEEEEEEEGGVGLPTTAEGTPPSAHNPRRLDYAQTGTRAAAMPQPRPRPFSHFGTERNRNRYVQPTTSVMTSILTPLRRKLREFTTNLFDRPIFKKGIAASGVSTHPAQVAFCNAHKHMMGAMNMKPTARTRDEEIARQFSAKVAKQAVRDSNCTMQEMIDATGVSRRQYDQVLTRQVFPWFPCCGIGGIVACASGGIKNINTVLTLDCICVVGRSAMRISGLSPSEPGLLAATGGVWTRNTRRRLSTSGCGIA